MMKLVWRRIPSENAEADTSPGMACILLQCNRHVSTARSLDMLSLSVQAHGSSGLRARSSPGIGFTEALEASSIQQQLEDELQQERLGNAAYARLLQKCSKERDLLLGKRVHEHISRNGLHRELFLGNIIVNMYAKCGSLEDARGVLDEMAVRNVISWTAMVSGNADQGNCSEALQAFREMQQEGVHPNSFTFGSILKACASASTAIGLAEGRRIHELVALSGVDSDVFVGTALVNMYGNCGSLEDARSVFDAMPERNIVSWSAMIGAYAERNSDAWKQEALRLFRLMQNEGSPRPDKIIFLTMLGICDCPMALAEGRLVHSWIVEAGLECDNAIGNALVNMYGNCGSPQDAQKAFLDMDPRRRDVIAWTSLIKAYAGEDAVQLFRRMQLEGVMPNKITFAEALNACAIAPGPVALSTGKCINACVIEDGQEQDVILGTALINVYAKCRELKLARGMFIRMKEKNLVSWTALITANAEAGYCEEAVLIYRQMQLEGLIPNRVSFIAVLTACSGPEFLAEGRLVHACVIEEGLESDVVVANAIINMYGKCGSPEDARRVFDGMSRHDLVSWNAMLAAYAQEGHEQDSTSSSSSRRRRKRSEEAFLLFRKMQLEGVMAQRVTLVTLLNCCTSLSAGKLIHARIVESVGIQSDISSDITLGNAICNMYAKCGALDVASEVFGEMQARDVVSWNCMITAYAQHGLGNEALEYLQGMQQEGVRPDDVTLVSLIFACSHGGLIQEGCCHFASMSMDYGIPPRKEHYGCVIDMLARAGRLDDAEQFLRSLPAPVDPVLWTTLLGSCRVQDDLERAKVASERIVDRDPKNSSAYVVLSNIYSGQRANCDRWVPLPGHKLLE